MSNMESSPSQALGIQPGTSQDVAGQLYGYMGWATSIPEIAAILRQAADDASAGVGWSQAQMDSALQKTEWWKTTDANKRTWIEKQANDPATVQSEITQKASQIRDQLVQQGAEIDDSRIAQIAQQALEFGWDDTETKAALDSELSRSPSVLLSKVGVNYMALAHQFGVTLSDDQVQGWAAHSIAGVRSDDQYRQYLVKMAKGMFDKNEDLQGFLDRGGTVDQYFDPYKQDAANTLGVNPNDINFTDPKWSAAINSQLVDPSGKPVGGVGPMTRQQWISKMKTDPVYGYSKTTNGINEYSGLGSTITTLFGGLPGVK